MRLLIGKLELFILQCPFPRYLELQPMDWQTVKIPRVSVHAILRFALYPISTQVPGHHMLPLPKQGRVLHAGGENAAAGTIQRSGRGSTGTNRNGQGENSQEKSRGKRVEKAAFVGTRRSQRRRRRPPFQRNLIGGIGSRFPAPEAMVQMSRIGEYS